MQSGLGMIGLKVWGAKQVILTFNTYDSMIESTKNKDCITNILAAQGKVIGYDLSSVGHSYISGVHVLIATSSTDSLHD
ncbi:hypothetical protein NC653_016275 [Populus alba x Populus x berolinensis]|uniref:Uncharacterized protein n=1 Tax=Populus alba x Populus x berolinensis TaxID=444605 RepID=A0AAD6VYZ9_9ROSI|nr:hypothetical protein NC653_016275 [Populus alba x Populus x berolinensis]